MARHKEFDVDAALQDALEVFWQKGYEATSMQDLVAAMGIQKASLYGTFGDKHSLYAAALRSYQKSALAAFEQRLKAPGSAKAALRALVLDVVEQAAGRQGKRGCFCVNANVELASHDAQIGDMLREHSERVEGLLEQTLRRAKTDGELPRSADCKELATFVYGILVALNVLAKQRVGRERLEAIASRGLAALES